MQRTIIAKNLLIVALSGVFIIFGIWKLEHPMLWIGWIPLWLEDVPGLSRDLWLKIFGIAEITLGLLLFVPRRRLRHVVTVLMAAHLVIVLTQTGFNDIFVRDVGLLLASGALFFLL
jgi:hypothetical protein